MTSETITDTQDSRHALRAESLDAAAEAIRTGHKDFLASKDHAVAAILETSRAALNVAMIVEQVHAQLGGPRFAEWWRDQALPVGFAHRYIRIAKTHRTGSLDDKSQLRLFGILPEPAGGNPGQRRTYNPFAWTKWTGKIQKNFEAIDLDELDETDVHCHLQHLEPIKRIIQKLEERAK